MPRPELKSVEDLGMKREKPTPSPTPAPESGYHTIKRFAGKMTFTPARDAGKYLSDAAEGMKK